MRGFVGPLLIVIPAMCGSMPSSAGDLDAVLAKATQGRKVPGAAVLTIAGDQVADQAVIGIRRLGDPASITKDDVWNIGSDGKAMTAVMVGRLVDRGVLSWNATVADLWPDATSSIRPEYRSATLMQLLGHTAGLPDNVEDKKALEALFFAGEEGSAVPDRRKAYVLRALQDAPAGKPGRFRYSNTGYLLAAILAENASGSTYEALMRAEVFEPLGMRSAGFGLTPEGTAVGHMHGRVAVLRDVNPAFFAPAGNIYLTLDDWARFCIDQLRGADGDGQLLKPATYALLQKPLADAPVAMGWFVRDRLKGLPGPVLYHEGSDGAWFAIVALFPKSRSGVLAVSNAGKDMDGEAVDIAAVLAAAKLTLEANRPGK